jgi:hypothetical protein
MDEQVNMAAKTENKEFWRKCPICIRNKVVSPEFQGFLPLVEHMEEHLQPAPRPARKKGANRYLTEQDLMAAHFNVELLERPKRKIADEAKGLLVLVSHWLQEALAVCPEINTITTSNINVADQLVDLVKTLPDEHAEQRSYFLRYVEQLRDTGMDSKWLRTPGSQVAFVADSMAGAKWNIPPSSSREYIRRICPKGKSARHGASARRGLIEELVPEGAWWKPGALDES